MHLLVTLSAFVLTLICLCATPYYLNRKMKLIAVIYLILAVTNILTLINAFA